MPGHAEWDYCRIDFRVIDDGRAYLNSPGNKLMWFQFVAHASGSTGDYIAARSEKTPLANITGTTLAPDASNGGHRNVLDTLLETLQRDGWESLPVSGGDWWARRLRRTTSARAVPKRNKLDGWLLPIAMLFLLIPLLWLGFAFLRTPFRNGMSEYILLPVTDIATDPISEPYRAGKILPVNLDTAEIDPVFDQLPDSIRAKNPSEVGTLIWIDCELDANWRNTHNHCELSIIDYEQKTIVDNQTFLGTEAGAPHATNPLNYRDQAAMVDYILNLPKK